MIEQCAVLRLATYNVENLFDAAGPEEDGFLDRRLAFLSGMIARIDADVLALQEIGSEKALAALLDRLPPLPGGGAREVVLGTPDVRGIRCAIVSALPVRASRVHTAQDLPFPAFAVGDAPPFAGRIPLRRGVVHAEIALPGGRVLHALSAHLKSGRAMPLRTANGDRVEPTTARARAEGELRSLVFRAAEALFLRGLVDDLLGADPSCAVALMGDLNDGPTSLVLRIVSGEGTAEPAFRLASASAGIAKTVRYSVLHGGAPTAIDHVLLSASLHARLKTARFLNDGLRDDATRYAEGAPRPTDSDHAPLLVEIEP